MPSNHLIFCHPLLLLPSIFPSIRVFSSESVLHIRGPKNWSFSFSISPSSEYSGLISFRMDWLDLLAVQGPLKHLLQHHSSKHQFFSTQLSLWSNSHIHTWPLEKAIVLTIRTFVGKVISDTCTCISEPLCCTPETNITLLINYIPMKNLKNEVITK